MLQNHVGTSGLMLEAGRIGEKIRSTKKSSSKRGSALDPSNCAFVSRSTPLGTYPVWKPVRNMLTRTPERATCRQRKRISPCTGQSTLNDALPSEALIHRSCILLLLPLLGPSPSVDSPSAGAPAGLSPCAAAVAISFPFLNNCTYGQHPWLPSCSEESVPKIGMPLMITLRSSSGSERGLTPSNMFEKYWMYRLCEGIVKWSTVIRRRSAIY